MKKLFVILMLLIATNAWGAKYFAQSEAGDADGSDCDNPIAIASISYTDPDVHLCGTIETALTVGANSVTITFEENAKISMTTWTAGTGAIICSGKTGLTIDGGTNGIIEATDNGSPSYTYPAGDHTYQRDIRGITLNNCDTTEIKNLTIKNMYHGTSADDDVYIPSAYAVYLVDSDSVSIHDCTISSGGLRSIFATISSENVSGLSVYDNTFSECNQACVVAAISTANQYEDVSIYGNTFGESTLREACSGKIPFNNSSGTFTVGNTLTWGDGNSAKILKVNASDLRIGVITGTLPADDTAITDGTATADVNGTALWCASDGSLWMHWNLLHFWGSGGTSRSVGPVYVYNNTFDADSGSHASTMIYATDYTTPIYIYNNVFIGSGSAMPALGVIGYSTYKAGAELYIRNNTFYGIAKTSTGKYPIWIQPSTLYEAAPYVVADIQNNIFNNYFAVVNDNNASFPSTITSDRNNYYNYGAIGYVLGAFKNTLDDWQDYLAGAEECTGTGNDCNSITSDPDLDVNYKITAADSPMVGTGTVFESYGTGSTSDKDGVARGVAWDIGAYEYSASGLTPTLTVIANYPHSYTVQRINVTLASLNSGDKLKVTLDEVEIYDETAVVGAQWVTATYTSLTAGEHTLRFVVTDSADTEYESTVKTITWTTLHNGAPTVGIGEYNEFVLGGTTKSFPVFGFLIDRGELGASPTYNLIDAVDGGDGIDTVEPTGVASWQDYLTKADQAGITVIGPTNAYQPFVTYRMGWREYLTVHQSFEETFEGDGYVLGACGTSDCWTESGTVNEDYSAAPLVGSQSVELDGTGSAATLAYTLEEDAPTVRVKVVLKETTTHAAADIIQIKDASSNVIGKVTWGSDGKMTITQGSNTASTSGAYSAGTTYYLWLDWGSGRPQDDVYCRMSLYVGTSDSLPTVTATFDPASSTSCSSARAHTISLVADGSKIVFDGFQDWMDDLDAYVDGVKTGYDALFAHSWLDEPDGGGTGIKASASQIKTWADAVKLKDTNHPNFVMLTGYDFGAQKWSVVPTSTERSTFGPGTNSSTFSGTPTPIADILSHNYYPYEYSDTALYPTNIEDYLTAIDYLTYVAGYVQPVIITVEVGEISSDASPLPTDAQVKSLLWLSVIHGANGIIYFDVLAGATIDGDRINTLTAFKTTVDALTGPLTSAPATTFATDTGKMFKTVSVAGSGRVDAMARTYDGVTYIFAARVQKVAEGWPDTDGGTETATFTVSGLSAGTTIYRYGEGTAITASSGSFQDTFTDDQVHIYQIGGEEGPPPTTGWGTGTATHKWGTGTATHKFE